MKWPADCYCVLLHADVAASWRLPVAEAASSGDAGGAASSAAAAGISEQLAGMALAGQQTAGSLAGTGSAGSSSGSLNRHRQGCQSDAAADQGPKTAPVIFSGYVSHQQLTAALGSQLAGDPVRQVLRAAAAAARGQQSAPARQQQPLATCRVSMRGPGGLGAADVAVSSYPPPGESGAAAAAAAHAQSTSPSRPKLFERAQLLVRGMAAAAKQAAAQAAGPDSGGGAGVDIESLHLKCALMSLMLPVDLLAEGILHAV